MARAPDAEHVRGPLPSTFSVRALGAIIALAAGAYPLRSARALAVESPERWAPDEPSFAAGFAAFCTRYALHGGRAELSTSLAQAARTLLAAARSPSGAAEKSELEAVPEPEEAPPSVDRWDSDRVLRHLERAVAHAHQLLERARWLCLLSDSVVIFREPNRTCPRRLILRAGQLLESAELVPGEPLPVSASRVRPLRARQAAFDRGIYDRLRTLTTELKRIQRDGGTAAVRVARDRWLCDDALRRILLWV
jgi:hypothetical protein